LRKQEDVTQGTLNKTVKYYRPTPTIALTNNNIHEWLLQPSYFNVIAYCVTIVLTFGIVYNYAFASLTVRY